MYKIIGFITLIAIILFAIILHLKNNNNKNESNNNPINEIYQRCALHNGRNPNATGRFLSYFDDLLTSPKQPEYEKGIFFVQSRCLIDGIPYLRPRSACSIEAAAKNNPQRDIFLIYTSPVGWPLNQNEWPTTIRALDEYQNIHFRNVQIKQLTVNSPVEEWLNETSRIWESNSMTEHLSDLMRTLLLYHYGGTYADLDYMILKDLSIAEINWIGSESEDNIESSIINFSFNGIGHEMAHESLREFLLTYDPTLWAWNGPDLMKRVLERVCNTNNLADMNRKQCHGFLVYPVKFLYPLVWYEMPKYFNASVTKSVLNQIKDAMGIHLWNSHTKTRRIFTGNGDAYDLLAREHCPKIYETHKEF